MADEGVLDQIQSRLREAYDIINAQQQLLNAHQKTIVVLGETLVSLHADTKITKIVTSTLLREVAGKAPGEVDRLVALSVARAEREAESFSPSARSAVLESIDEMILLVE